MLDSPEFKNLPPLEPRLEQKIRTLANIVLDRAYEETTRYQKEKADGKNPKLPWEKDRK